MIHEAMVLDHGGPLLGLVEYASAMKLFVLESLLARLLLPFGVYGAWLDWAFLALGTIGTRGSSSASSSPPWPASSSGACPTS